MTGSYVTVEIRGVKYVLDSSVETVKVLSSNATFIASHAAQSLVDTSTGSDYVVTTGKTFTALGCFVTRALGTITYLFYSGDSADATTSLKNTLVVNGTASSDEQEYPLKFTVAASKYLTVDPDSTGVTVIVIGFES